MPLRDVRELFRYSSFLTCRILSAGLGYALSTLGIASGSEFGRLIAFLDAAKPVSGLLDSLAMRATGRVVAYEMLLSKATVLLIALVGISLLADSILTIAVIATYMILWWLLTSFSIVFMRREKLSQYVKLSTHSALLLRSGIRRVITDRSTIVFMGTSTIAALAYTSLYLFHWTKQELLSLRLIDATLLLVSFTAQLVIRGEKLSRATTFGTIIATFTAAIFVQYFAGWYLALFLLCRVASLFACARAMRHRWDSLISMNQALLATSYLAFSAWATSSNDLPALLFMECVSLFALLKFTPPTRPTRT